MKMMSTQSTNIRIDTELKKQAQKLFGELGLDMSTAVNMFLRQAVREQAIPFRVGAPMPNAETREALAEAEDIIKNPQNYQQYATVDEMVEDILK